MKKIICRYFVLGVVLSMMTALIPVAEAAPSPVSGFSASAGIDSMTLSWVTPSEGDLSQFEVRYSTSPLSSSNFGSGTEVGSPQPVPGSSQGVTIPGLAEGSNYYAGIRTYNIMGQPSSAVFVSVATQTSGGECINPPAVSGFSGSGSNNRVSLSWNTPSQGNLSQFEVRYSTSPLSSSNFGSGTEVGSPQPVPGSSQSADVSGLTNGTAYYFGIRVFNLCGESSSVVFASAVPSSSGGGGGAQCVAPSPVSNLVSSPDIHSVDLSWDTPQQFELSQFEVRYSTSPLSSSNFGSGTEVGSPQPVPGSSQGVTASGLDADTPYYFGIRTYNLCGSASPLVFVSATTKDEDGGGGNGGGGTGGGGGGYVDSSAPTNPTIVINEGDATTATTSVELSLGASGAAWMAISNYAAFSDAQWETFKTKKDWELLPDQGQKTVYAKYQSSGRFESSAVSDDILFEIPVPEPEPEPEPLPVPEPVPEPEPAPAPVSAAPVDFNALMVAWGNTAPGARGDLNFDGVVNNRDVSVLAANWNEIEVIGEDGNGEAYPSLVSISPTSAKVSEGQDVSFVVTVLPERDRDYTAQVAIKYPSEFLRFKSMQYGAGWVPVVRPGYDMHDAERGIIVKTAGVPEGFSQKKMFAVITFETLVSGGGELSFEANSFTLDAFNNNTLAGVSVPDRAAVQALEITPEGTEALASIISFGEGGNFLSVIILFVFFGILYLAYRFLSSRRREIVA